jgi:tRNA 2-thiouridine synthesizing protein A
MHRQFGECDVSPSERMDLNGVPCPQNSARALLQLEAMDAGEVLELLVDDGEPCERVPVSLEWEGHAILSMEKRAGHWKILVRRGED